MSFLQVVIYMGTFIFALTGAFKARAYRMDIFGGLVVAFATAYGGGTIRPAHWHSTGKLDKR